MKLFHLSFFILLLFSLSHCGHDSQSSKLLDQGEPPISLVAMGGNISCGVDSEGRPSSPYAIGMYPHVVKLVEKLQTTLQRPIDTIVSCYNETPTVHYVSSHNPEHIREGSRDEFADFLQQEIPLNHEVVYIGHSYGGWLTMKMSLEAASYRRLKGVMTIDPISRETCTYTMPLGCTESPSDIGHDDRMLIQDSSDIWINFWQNKTWYLHASEIDEADRNVKVNASHTSINRDEKTWDEIESIFFTHLFVADLR